MSVPTPTPEHLMKALLTLNKEEAVAMDAGDTLADRFSRALGIPADDVTAFVAPVSIAVLDIVNHYPESDVPDEVRGHVIASEGFLRGLELGRVIERQAQA